MNSFNQQNENKIETNIGMDEVEIKYIKKFLFRNSKLIISTITSGFLLSIIYSFLVKEVWQGEFQIVLEEDSKSTSLLSQVKDNQALSFLQSNKVPSKLNTEVEILKSPSVLMSVFDYVKENKINKNKNLSFNKWSYNLNVQLEKGTSVLNIKYKDKDKALILPVLNQISEKYQTYSSKKRGSQIEKGLNYLTNQINLFSLKSKNSLDDAQRFSIKHAMPFPQISQDSKNRDDQKSQKPSFQDLTVDQTNSLNFIQKQIEIISKITEPIEILSFANNNEGFNTSILQNKINKLARERSIYNKDSENIKLLESEIESKSLLLKNLIISDLETKKYLTNERKKVFERPTEIVLKYQNLWQKVDRNLLVLNNLESQFIALKLDEARDKEPWNLITKPTLLDTRIFPNRKNIVITWFFYSIVIAFLASYFREKSKNQIYKKSQLQDLIPFNLIESLSIEDENDLEENISFFSQGNMFLKDSKKIQIISLGKDIYSFNINLCKSLNKMFEEKTFYTSDKINDLHESDQQILVCTEGISKDKLDQFFRRLKYQESNIVGWLLIEI